MLTALAIAALVLSQADAGKAAPPAADAGKPAAAAAPAAPPQSPATVTFAEGFAIPESVLYDAAADQYLVSNINGSPFGKDNNGYIAVLSPDGKVVTPKFIAGGEKGVTLNAPKGMGLDQGVLYVADIDTVRMFDRKTGAPKGELPVAGATFLNDIAVGPGHRVFVSDSGLKEGFAPSGADAVYELKKKKLEVVAKGEDLGHPNGLVFARGKLHVVTFGSGELYALDKAGKKVDAVKPPKGSLDGVVELAGEELLISSWEGQAVYKVSKKGEFTEVLRGLKSPADLGWDSKRKRVLVPRFEESRVEAFELK